MTQLFINLRVIFQQFLLVLAVAPSSSSTGPTTDTKEGPDSGARSSGLSDEAMWGIIGACIAVVVIVAVVIVVCCFCRKRKGSGANKGKYD